MPRFVVLQHHPSSTGDRPLHWDLMLEQTGTLRTWALDAVPEPGRVIRATALPDHRMEYLTYEGALSRDRGTVERWDGGSFLWLNQRQHEIVVRLVGQRLSCDATLVAVDPENDAWEVNFGR